MTIKKLLLVLLFLGILNSFSVYAQVTCNSTLVASAFLTSNLNCPGYTAITLNNSNIFLDCAGFSITGDNTGATSGVEFMNVNNVTVRNCIISNYTYGIRGIKSNGSTLFNNNLFYNQQGILMSQMNITTVNKNVMLNNTVGVSLSNSQKNDVKNNIAQFNTQHGMFASTTSDNNTFTSNNCSFNSQYGIYVNGAEHNNIIGNRFIQNGQHGFYGSSHSHNTTLINNTAINNTLDGFRISTSSDSVVINNTAINNSFYGIYLHFHGLRGVVKDNTARRNKYYGINIYTDCCTNVTNNLAEDSRVHSGFQLNLGRKHIFKNNIARNNNRDGFELTSRGNHTFINNTAYGNGDYGFHLHGSEYNNFTNNTAFNNQDDGFYLYGSSDGNTFTNNTARNNGDAGFYLYYYGMNYNVLIRNTAFNNSNGGFILYRATFTNLTDNEAINNTGTGFSGAYSTDNIYINNTANFNSAGFWTYWSSHRNKFINNSAYNNTGSGFSTLQSNSSMTGNVAKNNLATGISITSSTKNVITNNTVINNKGHGFAASGCGASSFTRNRVINNSLDGLHVRGSSSNNNFTDFVLHHNAKNASYSGIHVESSSLNNIFSNFSLLNNSMGIYILATTFGTPSGNLFVNFSINNSATSLYVQDALNNTLSRTYCPVNVIFNDTTHGVINYTQDINLTTTTKFSDFISFSNNMIHVNSSGALRLNKSAILTLTGLSIAGDPQPMVDFNDSGIFSYCPPPNCVELLNNSITTFVYNVTHFTNYSSLVIPFGNLTNASIIVPNGSITVNNSNTFNVTCRVYCTGARPCVNTTVTLDPLNPLVNLTQPEGFIQDIYADSEFIYGPSDDSSGGNNDNFLYVWNKTSLGLYTRLPGVTLSQGLQSVYADNKYIYAGGRAGNVYIWNRTDYVTPFASVYNYTRPPWTDRIVALLSDDIYLYAGSLWWNQVYVHNKSHPQFANVLNLTDMSATVQALAKDGTYLYAGSQDCNVYIYNRSNLLQPPTVLPGPAFPNCQFKSIDVDNQYIYGHGQLSGSNWEAFTRIWNVTGNAVVFDWNDTTQLDSGMAFDAGDASFYYQGGIDTSWTMNGWLEQWNKTSWSVADRKNYTNLGIKSIFCDDTYLYAGTQIDPWSNPNGSIMVFNNSCIPAPPPTIIIHSLVTVPSPVLIPLSAYCSANITFNGTRDTVFFNLTHPNGSSTRLSATNVGNTYNSQNFMVSSMGTYKCTVLANDTNGTTASRSLRFSGGNKGAIPMNSGSPFYTIHQNPRYSANQSCLNSTNPGGYCDTSWSVTVNGTAGTVWEFFCSYENANGDLDTPKINVTISGAPPPPPPRPPSGGGGGGGAARAWQQIEGELQEEVCIESWFCEPWSECEFGETTRTCVDMNACGTIKNKPPELMHCKVEEIVVEEPAAFEEVDIEEIQQEEFKSTVVKGPEEKSSLLTSRNALRAALFVIVLGALVYIFALSRFLRARALKPKKTVLKEEDFPAVSKKVPVKKIKPKALVKKPKPKAPVKKVQPKKKPEPLPDTTKGLLKEINKL